MRLTFAIVIILLGSSAAGWADAQRRPSTGPLGDPLPQFAQAGKSENPVKTSAITVPSGRWSLICPSFRPGRASTCRVFLAVYMKKTRQLLLGVSVMAVPGKPGSVLVLRMPLGPYLPAGVTVQIDKRHTVKVAFRTCDARGCFASLKLPLALKKGLLTGKRLRVTFQNLLRKDISIAMPLAGFRGAYRKMVAK